MKKNNVLLLLIMCFSILPTLKIGSFSMPVLYIFIPVGLVILVLTFLGKIKVPYSIKVFITLAILVVVEILISSLYGTVSSFGRYTFPNDIIQYVARFLTLIVLCLYFYNKDIKPDTFIKYFLIVLNIAMLIGILQWVPWPGREFFISLYPFRDGSLQLSHLNRALDGIRMHGIAQHATANGGLAAFFFVFGFSILRYYSKYKKMSLILITLSIVNVFASQARGGFLALIAAIILFYLIDIFINKKSLKPTFYFLSVVTISTIIVYRLYINGNPFIHTMIYRWNVLFENSGGGRIDQINYFMSLFSSPLHYLFGLSKTVINHSVISYGVEIEPVNIFVTYGIFGFIIQYSMIVYLFIYFLKKINIAKQNKNILALLVASFVGLMTYQIFSIAFFFFREVNIGLFPWILMGVTIGSYERHIKNRMR